MSLFYRYNKETKRHYAVGDEKRWSKGMHRNGILEFVRHQNEIPHGLTWTDVARAAIDYPCVQFRDRAMATWAQCAAWEEAWMNKHLRVVEDPEAENAVDHV